MTSTEPGKGGIPAEAAGDGVQVNFVVLVSLNLQGLALCLPVFRACWDYVSPAFFASRMS